MTRLLQQLRRSVKNSWIEYACPTTSSPPPTVIAVEVPPPNSTLLSKRSRPGSSVLRPANATLAAELGRSAFVGEKSTPLTVTRPVAAVPFKASTRDPSVRMTEGSAVSEADAQEIGAAKRGVPTVMPTKVTRVRKTKFIACTPASQIFRSLSTSK